MLVKLYTFVPASISPTPASARLLEGVNASGLLVANSVEELLVALPLSYCGIVWIISLDRKSTRLNSSHVAISYAVFCLKKKSIETTTVDRRYRLLCLT